MDVMASGSDLPRLIGEHLYAPSGITHWRQLGEQLEIPFEAYKDRCYGYGKSRVEKVLNVLAEDSDATLWDVVEALRRMGRIDAMEMIAQDFPDVMVDQGPTEPLSNRCVASELPPQLYFTDAQSLDVQENG